MAGLTLSGPSCPARVAAASGFRNAVRALVYRRVDGRSDVNEFRTTAPPSAAMQLTGLHKRFGEKVAVEGLTLTVPTGSFYGLVGPNGAGKTTTLSMATGLLQPDAGQAFIHGVDVWRHPVEAKRMLGNLADGVKLFDRLTGEQLVTYTGQMFGIARDEIARRTADLIRIMDLGEAAGTPVVDYSEIGRAHV